MNLHPALWISVALLHAMPVAALQDSYCSPRDETPGEHGFGTFFDSAAVAGVIEREWNPEWGVLVASLGPDSTDAAGALRVYSTAPETGGVARIAEWLLAFRNATPLPDSMSLSVVLAEGDEVRPRSITTFAQCRPRMLDRERVEEQLKAAVQLPALRDSRELRSGRSVEVVILGYVWTHGRPVEYRIRESSGYSDWDQIAGRAVLDIEFTPALLEGVPVAVWVEIPVVLKRNSGGRTVPSLRGRSGGGTPEGTLPR